MTRGLRVIDLAGPVGAYGARLLADLGADVVKVEPPGGDPVRRLGPHVDGVAAPESSLWWAHFAAGKRSVVVDRATAKGRDDLARLIAGADIVIESEAPGSLDRAGLGYARFGAADPRLIWVSVTPFGLSGPRRDWKSSNLVAWAMSGVLYTSGFPDRPPVVPGGPALLACHTASLNAAIGALIALRGRRRTGRGQQVDVSLQEACVAVGSETGPMVFLDDLVPRPRVGNRRPVTRPWGIYPTSDGYASVVVLQPAHWKAFAQWVHEVTGNEAVLDPVFGDMRTRWEASEAIDLWTEELTLGYTKNDLFVEGQRRGIPITPVSTAADLVRDEHLAASGFFSAVEHPVLGPLKMPGVPFKGVHGRPAIGRAPLLGEHTAEVLESRELAAGRRGVKR